MAKEGEGRKEGDDWGIQVGVYSKMSTGKGKDFAELRTSLQWNGGVGGQ
jgi:hypothetical protein